MGEYEAAWRCVGRERAFDVRDSPKLPGSADRVLMIAFEWMTSVGRQPVIFVRRTYLD